MVWTQYTDLYLNFGIEGIVVGAVALGLFCRWLGNQLLRAPWRTPETIGVFVVFFAPLWAENPMGFVFQAEVQLFMLLGAVLLVIRAGVGTSSRTSPLRANG
jgi:hypothetical protein